MANVDIRRIIGNKDTKIGELQWDSIDGWDNLEYFLDYANDLLDPNNSGLYVYMMEKEDLSAEEFGAEEFEAQEVDFWNQVAENKFSVIIYDTDSQKFYGGFVKEEEEFGAESSVWAEIKEELGEGVSTSVYFIPKKPQTHSEMRSMIKEYFGITGSFPSQSHFHFITNDGYDIIPTTENDEGFDEPVFHIRKQDNERSWGAENKRISKPKEVVVKEECGLCGDTLILVDDGLGQKYKTCLGESCGYILPMNAEGMNLRKRIEDLIDLREINFTGLKKDTKREAAKRARRIENELKGVLPKGKSYKVDKPKWFTIAQTGIVLGVAGLLGYSGFKNKE